MTEALSELISKFGSVLSQEGESEFIFRCPDCDGKLSANPVLGVYHCFKCGYGKGQRLKTKSSVPKRVYDQDVQEAVCYWVLENCQLDDYHEQYLVRERNVINPDQYGFRTIPLDIKPRLVQHFGVDALEDAGVLYDQKNLARVLSGRRIFIPYWYEDRVVGFKTRSNPYEEMFDTYRYGLLPGTRTVSYPYVYQKLLGDVLITEGEFKAIAGHQNDYFTISLPGINPSQTCIQNTKQILRGHTGRRFIVFDMEVDLKNHWPLLKSIQKMAKVFKASPVWLPRDNSKMGLDDYFTIYSWDDMDAMLDWSELHAEQNIKWIDKRVRELYRSKKAS